jgi:hypothetical protein
MIAAPGRLATIMFLFRSMSALLDLLRKLIDYGKELAATLPQRTAGNPYFAILTFGTNDLAVILARITRGLQRASALEARLVRLAARPTRQPNPSGPTSPRTPRPAQPAAVRAGTRPAPLSTEEQIAADLRRPIGAVIADICRDLAIRPNHPLWREIQNAIDTHGGSYIRLLKDVITRRYYRLAAELVVPPEPPLPPFPAPASTGPP